MSDPSRIVIPGVPHHVCVRGNNQRILFSSKAECEQFLFFAVRAKSKVPVDIHALTLMTNHAHLVIVPHGVDDLRGFMLRLDQRYALWRNELHGGSGKLFEQEYFSKPILDEAQLAITLAYVELNPVRAGIPKRSWKHKWTTYWNHIHGERTAILPAVWTPSPWYLELGRTDDERSVKYSTWVKDCLETGRKPEGVEELEAAEAYFAASRARRLRRPDGLRAA